MKEKFVKLYIDTAWRVSELSHARRLKVGAVIVKDHRILSYGYNGTPSGFDNNCEIEIPEHIDPDSRTITPMQLVTKPEVVHAEMNALMKMLKHGDSSKGANIFITHAPCVECSKAICQAGIDNVYFSELYRSTQGIELLQKSYITVCHYESNNRTIP